MTYRPGVTVVIPHIPVRAEYLSRALRSVLTQTRPPDHVIVSVDADHQGSAVTRNKVLRGIDTEFTSFLDDDDEMFPDHLKSCLAAARIFQADVVYPGCEVVRDGVAIPRQEEWGRFGQEFDADLLREKSYIPVTSVIRTEFIHRTRGFEAAPGTVYDDWGFYLQLLEAGAKFHHLPRVTWRWDHTSGNTSGQGDRW